MEVDFLEHPALSLINFLLILCLVYCCERGNSYPSLIANADTLQLVSKRGLKIYKGVAFTGMVFKQESKSGDTLFIENYFKGQKH